MRTRSSRASGRRSYFTAKEFSHAHFPGASQCAPSVDHERRLDSARGSNKVTALPSGYLEGYQQARVLDAETADVYLKHTLVGDQLADAAVASLAELDHSLSHRIVNACMQGDADGMRAAPAALREFFGALDDQSEFRFDPKVAASGAGAFHKYSDLFFFALVLESVITGFTTSISKSFYTTGRTAGNLRRLQQNARHLTEITLPGGLERHGDGWKLTVRIRLVHAQIRRLLNASDEWNKEVDGMPLHMSHMALAATGFSAVNLRGVRKLGVKITERESRGFMHIWHYVSWLLGVPAELLRYLKTEQDAIHLKEIGYLCEPPPGLESVSMAHDIIRCVPELMGVREPARQRKITSNLFRTSRALLGHELADALRFPRQSTFGMLALVRMQRRFQILRSQLRPGALPPEFTRFAALMQRSVYDDAGITYRMPDAVRDSESSEW